MNNPSTHKPEGLLPEKIQVLHIDDEEDFLYLTKEFIEKMSEGEIQVESLKDSSKVIERITSGEIDVIVCDYLMEDFNGLDLLKTIKEEGFNLPFIIFTGRGREEVVIDALNLGADYYIRKGSDARSQYTELVHQIRTVLRHKKAEEVLIKRELELKRERDISQLYLNEANAMFVIVDADENVVLMNKEVTKVLGYTEKDLMGKNWFTTIYSSDISDEVRFGFQQVIVGMRPPSPYSELECITKSGEKILVAWHNTVITDKEGKDSKLLGVGNDITKRKEMEAALRESEEKYRGFVQNFDGIAFQGTIDYKPLFFHGAVEKITGYTEEDFVGGKLGWDKLVLPEDLDNLQKITQELESTPGFSNIMEYRIRHKNGELRWIRQHIQNISEGKDKGFIVQGSLYDITEEKLLEEKIKESENKFKSLFEGIPDAVFITDVETTNIVDCNKQAEKLLERTREEILLLRAADLHPEDYVEQTMETFEKHASGETGLFNSVILTKNNNRVIVSINASPLTIKGKKYLQSSFRDITEIRRKEEQLKRSETRYKRLVDTSPDGIVTTDLNGKITFANLHAAKLYGLNRAEELVDLHFTQFVSEGDMEKAVNNTTRVFDEGVLSGQEYKLLRKDGTSFYADVNVSRIDDYAGNPISLMSVIRDISERKTSQARLSESEMLYRTIFESTGMANLIVSQDKIIKMVNSKLEELSGYSKEEIEGKLSWTQMLLKDDAEKLEEYQRLHDQDPDLAPETFEVSFKDKTGKTMDAFISVKTILGTTDFIVTVQDITQIKTDEQKLRESANLYRTLFEATGTLIAIANKDTLIEIVNERLAKFSGYSKEELEGKMSWTSFVDDTDLERLKEINRNRLEDPLSAPERYEARLKDKEGNIHTCLLHIGLIPETEKYIISMIDITEAKNAEKEYIRNANMYKTIFEATGTANLIMGSNRIIKQVNSKVEEITGHKPEDLIGENWSKFVPEESMTKLLKFSRSRAQQPDMIPVYIETNFIDTEGNVRDVILSLASVPNSEDYVVSFFDITARKKAEENIKRSEMLYRTVFETTGMANIIFDMQSRIILVNSKMEELSGYNKEELEGKNWFEFIPQPELEIMMEYNRKRMSDPSSAPEQYETRIIAKSGNINNILIAVAPIPESTNYLATVVDISDRKKIMDTLTKQKQELSDFAHLMAHDIRNCLSSIEGYVDLVLEDDSESEQYLVRINKQTDYMRKLLDRSIELAEAGHTVEKSDTVDLNELIPSIATMTIPSNIQFSTTPLFSVKADKEKLSQIFKNILENAVIHGQPREVEVKMLEKDDVNVIKIINDGKLINKEIVKDAFETAFTTKEKESIHGLAIVKRLVDAHNWDIVLCEVTEKSCFDIIIPKEDIVKK
ncbi:MAG: PAS domain S-box protein [Candidatus Heimdallarchaeaceae archaeon]